MIRFHFQNPDTGSDATVTYEPRTKMTSVNFANGSEPDDQRLTDLFFHQRWADEDMVRRTLRRLGADYTISEGR